ncbi:unnamed protein product [Urochloa decumbens]|uniref:B box-type domain-containing protein n=1 Tax=Urochloa decumbens TaxID=240449 RepID=A0ABC9H122_9POAL
MGGGAGAAAGKRGTTRCELCGGAAAVHCAADSAFLCLRCDARVHGANFLASRHLRRRLGAPAAAAEESGSSASAASSCSCVSTADSAESTAAAAAPATPAAGGRKLRRRPRAEAVLEGWLKRMGFAPGPARRRAAAAASALRALGRGVAAARVPLRVAMAAALWAEITASATVPVCKGGEAALLRRLEAAAHVPARLVLTVASWMARATAAAPHAAAGEEEEGWAECS